MPVFDPSDKIFDAIERKYTPFPAGQHLVFISDVKPFVSEKGSEAIEVSFTIHDPASKFRGRTLRFQRFWLSEKSLWRLARLCRNVHGKISAFDPRDASSIDEALLDRIVVITVETKVETYKGKEITREEAKDFSTPSVAELSRLREEYGASMLPPSEASSESEGDSLDEEIPF